LVGRLSSNIRIRKAELLMDKEKKAELRKLRKKAIKMQNTSSRKMKMPEAMREVQKERQDV